MSAEFHHKNTADIRRTYEVNFMVYTVTVHTLTDQSDKRGSKESTTTAGTSNSRKRGRKKGRVGRHRRI